jgi:hypothetical protein
MNKQILAAFSVLLFILAITGFVYSYWTSTLYMQGTANTAQLVICIEDHNTTWQLSSFDNRTLELEGSIMPGQTNWTGIIIRNNGTTPATVTYDITTNNTGIWQTNFTHDEYFYGPYATYPPSATWEKAPSLPPMGEQSTPPELPAQNALVSWQNITLNSRCPKGAFTTIEINATYTATFSTWTDAVSVIYTLTLQDPP